MDADNGAQDSYGFGCDQYANNPAECGLYNDDDFDSDRMCCACLGRDNRTTPHHHSYLCNIVTDSTGQSFACPAGYQAHLEQAGICSLRAAEGPGDARNYLLPNGDAWPNSAWAVPIAGAPNLIGSTYFYSHGLYLTNGIPVSVCEDIKAAGVNGTDMNTANDTSITTDTIVREHKPQENGTCAFGYELVAGSVVPYGSCEGSAEISVCILSPFLAAERCEEDPVCSGVSETTNTVWQKSYPGKQILGRAPIKSSFEWKTCKKAAVSRTWDHLVADAASLLEGSAKAGHRSAKHSKAQAKKNRAENVAGLGPAINQWL